MIVEAIGDPALYLFARGAAFIHRHLIRMVDVVIRALGSQCGFELGFGQWGLGHRVPPENTVCRCWRRLWRQPERRAPYRRVRQQQGGGLQLDAHAIKGDFYATAGEFGTFG